MASSAPSKPLRGSVLLTRVQESKDRPMQTVFLSRKDKSAAMSVGGPRKLNNAKLEVSK